MEVLARESHLSHRIAASFSFVIVALLLAELEAQRAAMQTKIKNQSEQLEKLFDLRARVCLAL